MLAIAAEARGRSERMFGTLKGRLPQELKLAGIWRVAFDPNRQAILLVAGDKSGGSEKRFCKTLIDKADKRHRTHLDRLAVAKKEKN